MSLYTYLLEHRTKEELAKELAAMARERAALQNRVGELETKLFWLDAMKPVHQIRVRGTNAEWMEVIDIEMFKRVGIYETRTLWERPCT